MAHRWHIGTGTFNNWRNSGESSDQYREDQRRLLNAMSVGVAVQLNQLYYAQQPEFRSTDPTVRENLKKADNSFARMIEHFPGVPLENQGQWHRVAVTAREQAEMMLSRQTARTGLFPSADEELNAMKKFGLLPAQREKALDHFEKSFGTDRHGIPTDGTVYSRRSGTRLCRSISTRWFHDDRRSAPPGGRLPPARPERSAAGRWRIRSTWI